MNLRLDHAVFGWHDHDAILDTAREVGLDPIYGGEHADGATEMSVVPFPDGSYLELIGPTGVGTPGYWPDALENDAGPCAWAVRSDDPSGDLTRLLRAGVPVDGPHDGGRTLPDGTHIEWTQVMVPEPPMPFFIADRTPREARVPPVESSPIAGVGTVVLAVEDLDTATDRFEWLTELPTPRTEHTPLGEVRWFPDQPFALVAGDAVTDRLAAFGPMPAAHLLRVPDMETAHSAFSLTDELDWFGERVAWFDADPFETRLGVIG